MPPCPSLSGCRSRATASPLASCGRHARPGSISLAEERDRPSSESGADTTESNIARAAGTLDRAPRAWLRSFERVLRAGERAPRYGGGAASTQLEGALQAFGLRDDEGSRLHDPLRCDHAVRLLHCVEAPQNRLWGVFRSRTRTIAQPAALRIPECPGLDLSCLSPVCETPASRAGRTFSGARGTFLTLRGLARRAKRDRWRREYFDSALLRSSRSRDYSGALHWHADRSRFETPGQDARGLHVSPRRT